MKKSYGLFTIVMLFVISDLYSQSESRLSEYKVLDTAILDVRYSFKRINDVRNPNKIDEDLHTLLIGKVVSKYYSQWHIDYLHFVDSLARQNIQSAPSETHATYKYEFFKNYPVNKITVIDLKNIPNSYYTYEDNIPALKWELSMDTVRILSYACQKATTVFRGRRYTAWFTKDIPINQGPWKFGGLPGLILKVTDSDNHYSFECVEIRQSQNETIKLYNRRYMAISRDNLMRLHQRMHNDRAAFYKMINVIVLGPDGQVVENMVQEPYNPIELE